MGLRTILFIIPRRCIAIVEGKSAREVTRPLANGIIVEVDLSAGTLVEFSRLPQSDSTSRPLRWPDVHPIHTHVPLESLHSTSLAEAIAAPQVCCRHCSASFPFPGATKGDTFTGAGQSL